MKQRVTTLETVDGPRVATLTQPDGAPAPLVALLPNTGMNNRTGPHRINVKIAHRLAALGVASLRLDLAGLGDSPNSTAMRSHEEQAVADLGAAMDWLQADAALGQAARRFAVVGICSGAHHGWMAAVADPRIDSLLLVDGPAYVGPKTKLYSALLALRMRPARETAAHMAGWLKRRLHSRKGEPLVEALTPEGESLYRIDADETGEVPFDYPKEQFEREAQLLVDRGVTVQMLNTMTWRRFYSYSGQFRDVFGHLPFARAMDVQYMPRYDHTFTRLDAQNDFLQGLEQWFTAQLARG